MADFCAVDAYLVLYNCVACGGWAIVVYLALLSLATSLQDGTGIFDSLAQVYSYPDLGTVLFYSQSMALLEIVHAAVGFVRSPVMVTSMQVMSRIVALYALVTAEACQNQWGAGLMIISWALVEVPRYAFYVAALITGDATKKTPFPLFWLRYSLFALLYPTGITGELTVFFKAAADDAFPGWVQTIYGTVLPIVYFFGSPFMIMNMAGNRAKSFKKRFAKPPPPPRGIVWPKDDKGVRSSTPVNKAILAAALGAADPELEQKVLKAKGWRFGYVKYIETMLKEQCKSPEVALKVAQAGLDKAYELFEFVSPDGTSVSFKEAMAAKNSEKFCTGFVKGEGAVTENKLEVPYKGKTLSGQALKDQIKAWVDYGTIEPSAGEAMCNVVDHPEWINTDYLKDRYFVLLGAGSAMGPFLVLMALGANVVAIDLDRPRIWERLITICKKSTGSITFPLKKEQSTYKSDEELYANAGCNLFTHTPMIRDWLLDLYPGKAFTVGSYAYLDGALHVQVSLAMDAITRDLSEKRKDTSLAYLCTPTDLHLIPKEAHDASKEHLKNYSKDPYCMMMNLLSNGKFLRKNPKKPVTVGGDEFYYVNGISVAQGPNYALAKRMQHWRAVTANSKGCIVSSNIAPSTSTVSVVHNRTFAWAYEGMPYFKPYEIFAPETSNAVMSAILFSDLNDPKSSGNPKAGHKNPNQLFSYGSFHGGVWRCAYMIDSIGEASVFLYFSRVAKPYIAGVAVVGAAVAAKVVLG